MLLLRFERVPAAIARGIAKRLLVSTAVVRGECGATLGTDRVRRCSRSLGGQSRDEDDDADGWGVATLAPRRRPLAPNAQGGRNALARYHYATREPVLAREPTPARAALGGSSPQLSWIAESAPEPHSPLLRPPGPGDDAAAPSRAAPRREDERFLAAGIVGAPNAGKSTLLNALAECKVSLVSRKVQATRRRCRALLTEGSAQVAVIDTPGVFGLRRRNSNAPRMRKDGPGSALVAGASDALEGAGHVILVADAALRSGGGSEGDVAADMALRAPAPLGRTLVMTKWDIVEANGSGARATAEGHEERLLALGGFDAVVRVASNRPATVSALRSALLNLAPSGAWQFPADWAGDIVALDYVQETIRERLLHFLHAEIPYVCAQENTRWTARRGADGVPEVTIGQRILAPTRGMVAIIVGDRGKMITRIRESVERALAHQFGVRVKLFLDVKYSKRARADTGDGSPFRSAAVFQ